MSTCRQLDIKTDDHAPKKWSVSLNDEVFKQFSSQGGSVVPKVFGDGSLFSPFLFGKFFDPSDAFPLWDFNSDVFLSKFRGSGQSTVDWFQTDSDYVLKSEIPALGENSVQICTDNGKVLEISGEWKPQRESRTKDWRCGHWWEHGYVRRLELPDDADWRKIEAKLSSEKYLEIRIPKASTHSETLQGKNGAAGVSELMYRSETSGASSSRGSREKSRRDRLKEKVKGGFYRVPFHEQAEKNELCDEKQPVKTRRKKLEQRLKAMNEQPFSPPPLAIPATVAHLSQTPGSKLVPVISCNVAVHSSCCSGYLTGSFSPAARCLKLAADLSRFGHY